MNEQHHVMELVRVDPDGLQEWACVSCQRRLRFHWASPVTPTILEPGDEEAAHIEPKSASGMIEHASGLSAVWLEAIIQLDMSVLGHGEVSEDFPATE